MIILSLLIDYFMTCLLPIKTYFVIWELDRNKIVSVFIAGLFLDLIFHGFLYNTIILVILYLILKKMKVKKRYYWPKNLLVFLVYFNILFFLGRSPLASYLYVLIEGLVSYVLYCLVMEKLFKLK